MPARALVHPSIRYLARSPAAQRLASAAFYTFVQRFRTTVSIHSPKLSVMIHSVKWRTTSHKPATVVAISPTPFRHWSCCPIQKVGMSSIRRMAPARTRSSKTKLVRSQKRWDTTTWHTTMMPCAGTAAWAAMEVPPLSADVECV